MAAFTRCQPVRLLGINYRACSTNTAEMLRQTAAFTRESTIEHGEGHDRRVYSSMLQLLSDKENPTPLVELSRELTGMKHARIYGKLEWYNPFGSVKDRVASSLYQAAVSEDKISGGKIVEASSGNTALGLAMMCNLHNTEFHAVMSNKIPAEKRNALRMFGAHVIELEDDL